VLYPPQGVRVGFTTTATEDGGYTTGADLTIANVTSGGAFDLDGYRFDITLPGAEPRSVDVDLNKVFRLEGLPPGSAVIDLADVAVNCSVAGGTSRSVELADGARARVDFDIQCTPPPELASVRLVFSRFDMLGGFGLWAINADGTGLRQLTPNVGAFDIGPKVSPVGSRVAFSRDWSGTGWGNFQIYLVNADGTDLLRLTETPLAIAWSWSPDGTRIASSPTSPGNIDLVEVDGSGRTRILGGFGGRTGFAPSWSPDGGTIAFYEGSLGSDCNVRIAAMDPDGGNVRVLRSLAGCTIGDLSWSSDGATIFFGDQDPDVYPALWRMDADGSNAQLVYPADDHVSGFGSLSADGRMMTVICRSDLCLLNLDEGTLVRVTADRKSWGGDFLP
jgi:Tol biopolymer transport system component